MHCMVAWWHSLVRKITSVVLPIKTTPPLQTKKQIPCGLRFVITEHGVKIDLDSLLRCEAIKKQLPRS